MTVQEARQILKGYGHLLKECAELRRVYHEYTGTQWRDSDEYRQAAGRRYGYYLQALKKAENEAERIEATLSMLPSLERRILRLHFFHRQTWRKVAFETGYSEEHIKGYLQKRALKLFAAWWPKV